ncbi:MAG: hypothetical protein ACOVN5_00995 [Aquidulcibacter sp.]
METDALSRILCARALPQAVVSALSGWADLVAVRRGVWVRRQTEGAALGIAQAAGEAGAGKGQQLLTCRDMPQACGAVSFVALASRVLAGPRAAAR